MVRSQMFKFIMSRVGLEVLGGVAATVLGVWLHSHFGPVAMQVVQTTPTVQTVYVDRPTIDTKVVNQVVKDPKEQAIIKELLSENRALKVTVTTLTDTVAELKQTGGTTNGGVITPVPVDTAATEPLPAHPLFNFKDWQLSATYNDIQFSYTLDQKFHIISTTGREVDGRKVSIVQLFQEGPNGERLAIPATTTAIQSDLTTNHWMFNPRIQGGLALTFMDKVNEAGGIVGLQWLKYGKGSSAEDVSLSLLTPTVFLSKSIRELGVMPISYNLGQLPHQPFTNLWVSPYIGVVDSGGVDISRVGVVLSATF
jgi:hypothetical protein